MVYHFWPNVLPGGMIGVDIFFVISGFLITSCFYVKVHSPAKLPEVASGFAVPADCFPPLPLLILVMGPVSLLVGGDIPGEPGSTTAGAATFSSTRFPFFR